MKRVRWKVSGHETVVFLWAGSVSVLGLGTARKRYLGICTLNTINEIKYLFIYTVSREKNVITTNVSPGEH
jgi:hypothetical protein